MIEPLAVYTAACAYWYLYVCSCWESVETPDTLRAVLE